MSKIFGVDLDDTLIMYTPCFLRYLSRVHEIDFPIENVRVFDYFRSGIGRTQEESLRYLIGFCESEDFLNIPIFPDARNAIERISRKGEIIIVTSRGKKTRARTESYLNNNFPGVRVFYSERSGGCTKADICRRLGVSVFVDDCVMYAEECQKKGVKTFLFGNYAWNKEANGLFRVRNWQEVLLELENEPS